MSVLSKITLADLDVAYCSEQLKYQIADLITERDQLLEENARLRDLIEKTTHDVFVKKLDAATAVIRAVRLVMRERNYRSDSNGLHDNLWKRLQEYDSVVSHD